MVDDRPEDTGSLPIRAGRKREPPTIDSRGDRSVERDESSARHRPSVARRARGRQSFVEEPPIAEPAPRPVSPWIVATVPGGRCCAGDRRRLDAGLACDPTASATPAAQLSTAIAGLTAVSPDWSQGSARWCLIPPPPHARKLWKNRRDAAHELAATRAQGEKHRVAINEVKSAHARRRRRAGRSLGVDELHSKTRARCELQKRRDRAARQQACRHKADGQACRRSGTAPPGGGALLECWSGSATPIRRRSPDQSVPPNPDALKPLDQFAERRAETPAS